MTLFSRSAENFQSNGGIVLPSNLKTRREKGRQRWYRKGAFFAVAAVFVKWSQNVQIDRVVQIVEYLKILPPRFQK